MKKWTSLWIVLIFLLAACSGANSEEVQKPEEETAEKESTEEVVEEEEKAEETNEEEKDTEEPAAQDSEVMKNVEPQYELTGNWSFEPIGDANPKVALLTIDDAPDTQAVEMAKTLKEKDAPAIFFVNGHFIDTPEEEEKLKEIHEMGFPIGNHTETHASLPDLSEEEQRVEIVGLNDKIEEIIGERPIFFRAPFGQNTDFSKQLAEEEGMLVMNWTYGYDWESEYQDAQALADIMVNTPLLNNGANLLMHDREWTNKALGPIADGLREKGYELLDPALIQTP
ncbi:polysaccharide deacetylase family protein [Halobacillus trueperi]|uniref:Peptidoglycan/xylan/chitin deacetylase, PgdA/CDA1 family n=2 Tax=Halobacillus TaxID=45667 RepID=A0A1H0PJY0_HALAD|nr:MULTISPECIES: polysaccharide deacetylase family protein [Halobacillus]RDY69970.1 polysaccharide deacetylase family protein [Halobacillus trueperi]SDP05401.1 Peptidoglycan/xylan/chitin deacetylase, PgdA/CDA1 family [Halobacillus aidingensis]